MDSEFAICPYNSAHKILRFRMPAHIVKCKKHYQGEPLEICPFNATHLVQPGEMTKHLETCSEHHNARMEEYYDSALVNV